jgi:autotransporter-associated beta strand protein
MTNNRFISNGFIAGTTGGTFIIGDAAAPSTITLPTTTSFTLSLAALAGPIVVNDVIQDAGGQAGIVTINPNSGNNNPVTLNGANTYTGGTNVGASGTGAVQIGISTAGDFGSIISGPFGTNAVNMASTSATPPALTPIGANRTVSNAINLVSGNLAAANVTGQTFNLDLTGPLALGTANRSIINNMAGTLTLGSVGSPQSITLSQNAGITLTFSGQSAATTVVNDVIQNHLSGNAGNIAVSSGTVNLTNGNAYSGTTTVTGGKLLVNNTAGSSGTGIGAVNVNGGTLGGNGFIGGAVTVNATGHLGPGNSAGQLTINNSVAFTPGSNFDVEIGGTNAGVTYDQLAVDLTAALDGSLNVSLVNGFVDPAVNTDFTILTAAGGVTGIFSNLVFPDANWSVVYNANSVIARFTAPPGGVPGDFNSNGKVDAADYVMWRKNNGTNNALANDGGLGVPIGQAHYNLWRGNFGKPPGAGSGGGLGGSPVPEPMTMVTLLMGAAAIVGMRRKR